MNTETRRIKESPLVQGVDERIAYLLTTTPWGSSPGTITVVLKSAAGTDVSATYLSGAASVAGDVITTPIIHSLVNDTQYRLEIKFICSGNTFEAWADVYGQT